ncbi:MAG: hypothetical protein JWO95_2204 [Verrucomicrobiales bacterium]|nr:hypothetical protein [Verrucomicrobiales bacterium]
MGTPTFPPLDPSHRPKGCKHWYFLRFDPSHGTGHYHPEPSHCTMLQLSYGLVNTVETNSANGV